METANAPAVLLRDLPLNALGGIDLLSFTTSPKFSGVKNLPPGIHFAFAGATSALSLRHGIWFYIPESSPAAPSLIITKWDSSTESLVPETDPATITRLRANIGSLWKERLTPYRQSASDDKQVETGKWKPLSDAIDARVLTRILGDAPDAWTLDSSSFAVTDQSDIAHLSMPPSSTGQPVREKAS